MRVHLVLGALVLTGLAGCVGGDETTAGDGDVEIRWTEFGIPHILADDWHGLGLGYGYAFARDNLCYLYEEIVTVNGQRSMYWGPDNGYFISSNGLSPTNLQSDLFWTFFNSQPDLIKPTGEADVPELQAIMEGYAAGVNRYLEDLPGEVGRHADCRDGEWIRPLTHDDLVKRFTKLQILASSLVFGPGMATVAPPSPDLVPTQAEARPATPEDWKAIIDVDKIPDSKSLGIGSNAYAFGSDATPNGAGMLLGNPHFSWAGPERFHELHMKIPGIVDTMGMTIHGTPFPLIGFTDHAAWSHTVSTGWRFTVHELKLVPGDPTSYVVDGEIRQMEPTEVEVTLDDGSTASHTFWMSDFGPITEYSLADVGPLGVGFQWTPLNAYAIQDANAHNDRIAEQFLAFSQAQSFDEFTRSLDEIHGIPWVNTIAAGPDGEAFYSDISIVPHITAEQIQMCNTVLGIALFELARLPVLDGSRSECDWTVDARAAQPGIVPAEDMPRTMRDDYVINSNDSYWLPNPRETLEGYSPMIGDERAERSPRTRMGYVQLDERLAGESDCTIDADVPCSKMTLGRLQSALFESRLFTAETELDAILSQTCTLPGALSSGGQFVSFAEACAALAAWDRRADVDSAGIALFERLWPKVGKTWLTAFDADDPVATPAGLLGLDPRTVLGLADAIVELQEADIALDATTAESRCVDRNGICIPIHGAQGTLGAPSYIAWEWVPGEGFRDVVHGNSYIQTVTWEDGEVRAEALLSYSQSTDPASPHYADQTIQYSRKEWVPLPFDWDDVVDQTVEVMHLS